MFIIFVDGCNLLFLLFVVVLVKNSGGCYIVIGVCEIDFLGYSDCWDVFVKLLNVMFNLLMDFEFVIYMFFMWIDKVEMWVLVDELGVFEYVCEKILICYNGIVVDGCGECFVC